MNKNISKFKANITKYTMLALPVALLSACGGSGGGSDTSATKANSVQAAGTITFYDAAGLGDDIQTYLAPHGEENFILTYSEGGSALKVGVTNSVSTQAIVDQLNAQLQSCPLESVRLVKQDCPASLSINKPSCTLKLENQSQEYRFVDIYGEYTIYSDGTADIDMLGCGDESTGQPGILNLSKSHDGLEVQFTSPDSNYGYNNILTTISSADSYYIETNLDLSKLKDVSPVDDAKIKDKMHLYKLGKPTGSKSNQSVSLKLTPQLLTQQGGIIKFYAKYDQETKMPTLPIIGGELVIHNNQLTRNVIPKK